MEPKSEDWHRADIKSALEKELLRSRSFSSGRCAEFTRKAIQAGGITLGHTYHAELWPNVRSTGFTAIGTYEMPREVTSSLFNLTLAETRAVMAIYDGAGGIQILNNAIWARRATGQRALAIYRRINENVLPCRAYPVAL